MCIGKTRVQCSMAVKEEIIPFPELRWLNIYF